MRVSVFIFDLHHTITKTSESPLTLTRRVAARSGLDISAFSDEELQKALAESDKFMDERLVAANVEIHWGSKSSHWADSNRVFFSHLGFGDLAEDILVEVEDNWKRELLNYESLTEDARQLLNDLRDREFPMGICTRRYNSPQELLRREGIADFFSTVWWTGVPGYAKPNPYTLIRAADDLKVNPRLCAYVGNMVHLDVIAAQRAGMIPILTTWANPEEAEKATEDVVVVKQITEILDYL